MRQRPAALHRFCCFLLGRQQKVELILGFDPGGDGADGKFGWGVAENSQSAPVWVRTTGAARHAEAAVKAALALVGPEDQVVAAGIDSPLYWTATGERRADLKLRDGIRLLGAGSSSGGIVQHPNSLKGACVVQGPITALLLRRAFPNLPLTESHPKALLWALGLASICLQTRAITASRLCQFVNGSIGASENERDAVLGAFAAWAMVKRLPGWSDLVGLENDPLFFTSDRVSYWFPSAG